MSLLMGEVTLGLASTSDALKRASEISCHPWLDNAAVPAFFPALAAESIDDADGDEIMTWQPAQQQSTRT